MTYYQLYLKYKNKYINLKKQIGSASLEFQESSNELILPCEINHNTSNLYISNLSDRNKLFETLQNIIRGSQISVIKIDHSFAQDAHILLKDNTKHYAIKTNTVNTTYPFNNSEIKLYTKCNNFLDIYNGNHFGGNFISSPENIIFTFDDSEFSDCLDKNLESIVVRLNCSFRYKNERHIDETMCFMPYGINNYKVWIYDFRKIEFDTKLKIIENTLKSEKINKILETFDSLKVIHAPDSSNEIAVKNVELIKEFKKIFWRPTDLEALKIRLGLLTFNLNSEEIIQHLNLEREHNLEIISQALFNGSYEDNSDKFVFFPLDIYIIDGNYKITNIPIFNRLYIETDEIKHCIFPISNQKDIDPEVSEKLDEETQNLRSYNDNQKVICSVFKTSEFNDEGNVGGNLHCLVKNQYS